MFTPYEKIASSPRAWSLAEHDTKRLNAIPWVATEKIHGANFCILSDGKTTQCAKRKALLSDHEDFFGHTRIIQDLYTRVQTLASTLQNTENDLQGILVYGELFGGHYPHPEVPAVPDVQAIQTGVWYSPDVHFCAFDLFIHTHQGERIPLSYERALSLFEDVEIMAAQPLFIGSWNEALEASITFDSTIPALLGLPALPPQSNLAEGLVIKPLHSQQFATEKGHVRPVLKRKIAAFSEDKRYSQAKPWTPTQHSSPQPSTVDLLIWEAYNKVTQNRLNNTISKLGPTAMSDPKIRKSLFAAFVQDVLDDLPTDPNTLPPTDRAKLLKELRGYTRDLFRECAPQKHTRTR